MAKYKCITKCYHNDQLYKAGDIAIFDKCDCRHFVEVKEEKPKEDTKAKK